MLHLTAACVLQLLTSCAESISFLEALRCSVPLSLALLTSRRVLRHMLSWHGCTLPSGSAATTTVHKASNPRPHHAPLTFYCSWCIFSALCLHVAAWGCHGGLLDRPSRSNRRAWKTGCGSFARFCFLVLSHLPLISHVLVQICQNAPL